MIRAKQCERLGAGLSSTTLVTSTPYAVLVSDVALLVDTTVPRTIQLPAPSTRWLGQIWDLSGVAAITLQRAGSEKINGVAANFVLTSGVQNNSWLVFTDATDWYVTTAANLSQIGPTLSAVTNTTTATTTPVFTISLADNTTYRLYYYGEAADASGNKAEWISYLTYYRINAGPPTLLGSDKGPAPVSNIATSLINGNWISAFIAANTFNVSLVTSSAAHLTLTSQLFVIPIAQGPAP